jgi:hypothetical protein
VCSSDLSLLGVEKGVLQVEVNLIEKNIAQKPSLKPNQWQFKLTLGTVSFGSNSSSTNPLADKNVIFKIARSWLLT